MSSDPKKPSEPQIDAATLGLADLDFFIADRLSPILQDFSFFDKLAKKQATFVAAELLESFLWIHLGVQLNYFPLGAARRVMYEFFPPFLRAHQMMSKAAVFETAFGSPLRNIWDSEFSGNLALFSTGRLWEESKVPEEGAELFRKCYTYANEFVQNEETRPFVQGIVLAQDTEWRQAVDKNKLVPDVETVEGDREFSSAAHWATPGVIGTVEYLRTSAQVNIPWEEQGTPSKSLVALRQRLREIQQWRLNFANRGYRDRFQLAAERVAKQVSNEEKINKRYLDEIYQLMLDWGAPLRHMTAESSA
jgi:hypothetical protein